MPAEFHHTRLADSISVCSRVVQRLAMGIVLTKKKPKKIMRMELHLIEGAFFNLVI